MLDLDLFAPTLKLSKKNCARAGLILTRFWAISVS